MTRLQTEKLHVSLVEGAGIEGPIVPRRYTLTHSDATGDLFLTIAPDYDRKQISGAYTRLMRDEVLAEWVQEGGVPVLNVHCHVSGGIVVGTPGMRYGIFRRELPLVFEAFRYGDRHLFEAHPDLDGAAIRVHFHARQAQYNKAEDWGMPRDYA